MPRLLLVGLAIGSVALTVTLSRRVMRRWEGVWPTLAWLPVVMIIAHASLIVVQTIGNPGSHSSWPLELIVVSGGGLLLLAGLAVVRFLLRPRPNPDP